MNTSRRTKPLPPLRVGVGGPLGSGKTTLVEMLCKTMRVMTNLKTRTGLDEVVAFIETKGTLVR